MERLSSKIYPVKKRPITIMQFGEGNFLRAFVDDFIQQLNDQKKLDSNIVVVQPMPFGRVTDLEEQDGLYTLFLEGQLDGRVIKKKKIIDVLGDFINPYTHLDKFLLYAISPELKTIISNTTEAGIVYLEEEINSKNTPVSFPGKLLLLLKTRFDFFPNKKVAILDVIACELIDDNGTELRKILIKLANFNHLEKQFIAWIENDIRFYNTLVDRIVPGYPKSEEKTLFDKLGYIDTSMVKGEIFHLWCISGPLGLNKRLPFDQADLDVFFVDDITPYKERKVKVLNGAHTTMATISYLLENRFVKESVEHPAMSAYINDYIYNEVIPTINLPNEIIIKFVEDVMDRFLNPFIDHKLIDISLNTMTKYKTRVLPVVIESFELGHFPKNALFSLASTIVFYRGVDLSGNQIPINDDPNLIDKLQNLWKKEDIEVMVSEIVMLSHWGTSVLQKEEVIVFLIEKTKDILNNGMEQALQNLLKG